MKSHLKIGLYSPYLPKHFGGGEKYLLDVARCLVADGHQVVIGLSELDRPIAKIQKEYEVFLGESLDGIRWEQAPVGPGSTWWKKLLWTKQFDVFYHLTDGSLWWSLAARSILHIQFPFTDKPAGIIHRLKLWRWPIKNANSLFTKKIVEKSWQTKIPYVHHPMVAVPADVQAHPIKKEKIILSVGRFFTHLHSKRQDVLVELFRQLRQQYPTELKGWKLVLIGQIEDAAYAQRVAQMAAGMPVELYHQASKAEVWQWYQKAQIYWHAAGYEIDELKEPLKVEHFGISTVEAMSVGAVPVVLGKGGQPEVLGSELKQYLWSTVSEAIEITARLIKNSTEWQNASRAAQARSLTFGKDVFQKILRTMIGAT